jgi:hypothetical protein
MRLGTKFVLKRYAPILGSSGPRRVTVAWHAYTVADALEIARLQIKINRAIRGSLWIESRDARAHRPVPRSARGRGERRRAGSPPRAAGA